MDLDVTVEPRHEGERELRQATQGLRDELLRAGVRAGPVEAPSPPGSKGAGLDALGQLVATGLFSVGSLTALAKVAVAYINRHGARRIKISAGDVEVVIDGDLGPEQQAAMSRILALIQEEHARGEAADS